MLEVKCSLGSGFVGLFANKPIEKLIPDEHDLRILSVFSAPCKWMPLLN